MSVDIISRCVYAVNVKKSGVLIITASIFLLAFMMRDAASSDELVLGTVCRCVCKNVFILCIVCLRYLKRWWRGPHHRGLSLWLIT